jgi:hypothetical protein
MLVKVKILTTHRRAKDCRTIETLKEGDVVSVNQKYAAEIIKDAQGALFVEEKISESKSFAAAPENKMLKAELVENKETEESKKRGKK